LQSLLPSDGHTGIKNQRQDLENPVSISLKKNSIDAQLENDFYLISV
jgi:hypothetical protein